MDFEKAVEETKYNLLITISVLLVVGFFARFFEMSIAKDSFDGYNSGLFQHCQYYKDMGVKDPEFNQDVYDQCIDEYEQGSYPYD
jgi:hypothetical protein